MKLYLRCIIDLAKLQLSPILGVQFAFIPQHQTHEVVYMLRSIVEKSCEWDIPVWIIDGDVHKAYDSLEYVHALNGLVHHHCPKILASALAREWKHQRFLKLKFGSESTHFVNKNKALIQGDPSAPEIFNLALDLPVQKFFMMCQKHKWGFEMNWNGSNIFLGILVFADNFWLICTNPHHHPKMLRAWLAILADY
eukprot:712462-Karenia_brevis.AAC.1